MSSDEEGGSGIVLGIVALLVVAGVAFFAWPRFTAVPRHRRRTPCASNLKQIGYACHLYSGDFAEAFPPGLGWLFPSYIPDGNVFVCPTARGAVAIRRADLPPGATEASAVFRPEHTDYEYVTGLDASDPPDLVLAFDKRGNHGDNAGRHVLFIGSNVEWMKEREFRAALARTLERLAGKAANARPRAGAPRRANAGGAPD